jgi:hypothetical protein
LTVAIESAQARQSPLLRMGVEVRVDVTTPGATTALTQINLRQKPIRLVDERQP